MESLSSLALALADRYRIERELGQGGMATVYLAQDLKHDRRVAIKVLKPELAAVLGADRFLQEIKTTAALQHPHILPLFDSGRAVVGGEAFLYYVMPFIEGETLRNKLDRDHQLGIDEAVKITTEVADALDYAHRHGVVHRDIKPENILLHDRRPMVADFGIALAVSAAAGGRMTETGLSLGTPHYMSPEQATAEKDITGRSDIYSLASVLYEMLTGNPPHVGASAQQIIMKIIVEPVQPVTVLRKSVPPNVAAALAKALERLPADRFESATAFAHALTNPAFSTPTASITAGAAAARGRWTRLTRALAAIALVTTVAGVWGWLRPRTDRADQPVVEFYLDPPDTTMSLRGLALSPDGRRLVAQFQSDSGTALYQRLLADREWRKVPGTDGGSQPFFSPDGAWLGFATVKDRTLKRIPLQGGLVEPIVAFGAEVYGATWGPNNTVIYAATDSEGKPDGLYRVSVDGGPPSRLTKTEDYISPNYVPGTDVVLCTGISIPGPMVFAISLTSERIVALTQGMTPLTDHGGHVVYRLTDGSAVTQSFDARALSLRGSPRRVAVGIEATFGAIAVYSLASDGSFVYQLRAGDELLLVDRSGIVKSRLAVSSGKSLIVHPRFSPSGDRIAYIGGRGLFESGTLWVYSLSQDTRQRLSFEGDVSDPAWSPDGRSIGYSLSDSVGGLAVRPADGTGSPRRIMTGLDFQMTFGPRPGDIVFVAGNADLFRATIGRDSVPVPLLATSGTEEHPALSPDGHWLAYRSNVTGQGEAYVRSYPDMGPATVVSIGGGAAPMWRGDGRELYYLGPASMMAATLRFEGSQASVLSRTRLFSTRPYATAGNRNYDVSPDGQRFVMVRAQVPAVWKVNALAGVP